MAFQFFKNGREITAPRTIKWRFAGYEQVFESRPEKLDINVNFWRRKLGVPAEIGIQIYEDDFEIKQKDATNISIPTPDTANIPVDNGAVTEPSVSQDLEDTVDTPKRRSRKKASDLSSLSSDVDNSTDTSAE
jgi:hypothetical protein